MIVEAQQGTTTSVTLPTEFSWTNDQKCGDLVRTIRDQATCGICWAFSAAGVIDSSLCLATGGKSKEFVSTMAMISCRREHMTTQPICRGGAPTHVLINCFENV